MRLFILNSCTSADFADLEIDVYKDEHEFVPSRTANKASLFFNRTARHLEAVKYALQKFKLQPHSKDVAAELSQLLLDGEYSDAGMLNWSKDEPGWDIMFVQADLRNTAWAEHPFLARSFFVNFWIFLYWLRYLIARVKLFETLSEIVKTKKHALGKEQHESKKAKRYGEKLVLFSKIVETTADTLIGLTGYALGDISNRGEVLLAAYRINEVNVVAAMQLVIPLKVLRRSEYARPDQKLAIDIAIDRIADGFRRQPIMLDYPG